MGRPQQPGTDSTGTLDLLILCRLAHGPMHGFGIAEHLHRVSDALHVEEGSLYPALHRLESQGLVESAWGVSETTAGRAFTNSHLAGAGSWFRLRVTAPECSRIKASFLEEERRALGELSFRQEYLCEFVDTGERIFSEEMLQAALREDCEPLIL